MHSPITEVTQAGICVGNMLWVRSEVVDTHPGMFECSLVKNATDHEDEVIIPLTVKSDDGAWVGFPRCAPHIRHELFFNIQANFGNVDTDYALGEPVEWEMITEPWMLQVQPVEKMIHHVTHSPMHGGVLEAPPGVGKTVMMIRIACALKRTTLIVVHTEELQQQWLDRIAGTADGSHPGHTNLSREDVGLVRGSKCEMDKPVAIALVQSLVSRTYQPEFYKRWGTVIFDECHRVPAETWKDCPPLFPAKYRIGCTATAFRRDGMEDIFLWNIGPVVHTIDPSEALVDPMVYVVQTDRAYNTRKYYGRKYDRSEGEWTMAPNKAKLETCYAKDVPRCQLIADYIIRAAKKNRQILVVSDRCEQLENIKLFLDEEDIDNVLYTRTHAGGAKNRRNLQDHQVLLATGKIALEGMDIPRLDVLCMVGLIGSEGPLTQVIGRICRPSPDKPQPIVLDFVDVGVSMATGYAHNRQRIYRRKGWEVQILPVAELEPEE